MTFWVKEGMLRVGKMADYGLLLMNILAREPMGLLTVEQLAQRTLLSLPTIRKVMRLLVNAHLVRSIRGVKGGYQLARLPALISVVHILAAVEGPVAITECCDETADCELSGDCDMEASWATINQLVLRFLSTISLADLQQVDHGPAIDMQAIVQRLQNTDMIAGTACG